MSHTVYRVSQWPSAVACACWALLAGCTEGGDGAPESVASAVAPESDAPLYAVSSDLFNDDFSNTTSFVWLVSDLERGELRVEDAFELPGGATLWGMPQSGVFYAVSAEELTITKYTATGSGIEPLGRLGLTSAGISFLLGISISQALAARHFADMADLRGEPGAAWLTEGVAGWLGLECVRRRDGDAAWRSLLARRSERAAEAFGALAAPVSTVATDGFAPWVASYSALSIVGWAEVAGATAVTTASAAIARRVHAGSSVMTAVVETVGPELAACSSAHPRRRTCGSQAPATTHPSCSASGFGGTGEAGSSRRPRSMSYCASTRNRPPLT